MHLLSNNGLGSLQIWLKDLKEFQLDSMFETNVLARAYLYINSITDTIEEKNKIESKIGHQTIYNTKIIFRNGEIYGSCTCLFEGKCKHLAAHLLVLIQK